MWIALLAWIPLLFGGWFKACVESRPPKSAQVDPSPFARDADRVWRAIGMRLVSETQARHDGIQARLTAAAAELPRESVDLPDDRAEELATAGTYGRLPEVLVDRDPGAIFPMPIGKPLRFSWYQAAADARRLLADQDRFIAGFERWIRLAPRERVARYGEISGAWDHLHARAAKLARQVRYLETWVPQLTRQWITAKGGRPPQYLLTAAIQNGDPRLMDLLREIMRPTRIMKRSFLPPELKPGVVPLPIATDINDRRFIAEIEGALATHWNQSSWARDQKVRFEIDWTRIPRDEEFARGRISLDEHLARFPRDRAAITTGGLSTYVHGQALVLGPGSIDPRTLAHELGHLLGFGDCYLRTLSSQGTLGLAVLEWDNPLYPDDLMCDNAVGAPRAEAW